MKKVTTRNTKSDIIKAYNELAKEFKALKAEMSKAASAPAAAEPKASPAAKASPAPSGEMSIADIITRLKRLTSNIGESASTLQGKLTGEITVLQTLRKEADGLIEELEKLHDIEVGDDSLDALIAKYVETSEAAEAELNEKQDAFEKEMSAERAAWRKERELHQRQVKEEAALLKKSRQRNSHEYKYDVEFGRKQEADGREQSQKQFGRELEELKEAREAKWNARENALAEREKEYAELQTKADAFEGELEAAVKKAEQEGTGVAKRQAKIQADLLKKDSEGTQRVFELKIADLEQTIAKQEQQIAALSQQLEAARQQTTELAVKAIEGASNASSFEAIKEIALEQAKNTQKGK